MKLLEDLALEAVSQYFCCTLCHRTLSGWLCFEDRRHKRPFLKMGSVPKNLCTCFRTVTPSEVWGHQVNWGRLMAESAGLPKIPDCQEIERKLFTKEVGVVLERGQRGR